MGSILAEPEKLNETDVSYYEVKNFKFYHTVYLTLSVPKYNQRRQSFLTSLTVCQFAGHCFRGRHFEIFFWGGGVNSFALLKCILLCEIFPLKQVYRYIYHL